MSYGDDLKTSLTLLPRKFRLGQWFREIFCPKLKCSPLCLNQTVFFCMIYRQCTCRQHCVRSSNYYGECSCGERQADRQRNGGRCSELCNFIVIINSFPVLNLGDRENYHEQTVNFSENHAQNLKISGCIVESVFVVSVAILYISLPIKNGCR